MKLRGWRRWLTIGWATAGGVVVLVAGSLAGASSFAAPPAPEFQPPAVAVQSDAGLSHWRVAREVRSIAGDPRGWRQDMGHITVVFVSPGRHGTERMPGTIGRSFGESDIVIISSEAWTKLGPKFAAVGGTLRDQRVWILQHELGHQLGFGHTECSGPGPAPVMRSTSFGLGECDLSVWPNPSLG